jgi:hypothetical protein
MAYTDDPDMGNLAILPVGAPEWHGRIVKGQTDPEVQGWWSGDYNIREACPVAIHEASAVGPAPFAWILVPSQGLLPQIKVQQLSTPPGTVRLRVQVGIHPADEIAVAMHERTDIPLSRHWSLTGRMARVQEGRVVQVVGGQVKDQNGQLIAEHRFDWER